MKKLSFLFSCVGLVVLNSCTDHEVIPPPVPLITLDCECDATIADSTVSYSNICDYESAKEIVSGGTSTARYRTFIHNEDVVGGLQLEVRSLEWLDDGSNNPTLEEFKTFFLDNPEPGYSDNIGHAGVEVKWTDPMNREWISDTTASACIKDFVFNSLIQESDTTGKYMKVDATFNCTLKNSTDFGIDTFKCLTNAHVRSAFKLE